MRTFLIKVFILLVILVATDICFGVIMDSISRKVDTDVTGRSNYVCDHVVDDVLIFGSSRARHHYNAKMMTDSLGVSCYNCGENYCGIILSYGRLQMLLNRYTPKTIIYDVYLLFDYLEGKGNYEYLSRLKPYYHEKGIDSIFFDIDPLERYKMESGMYRHNSSFLTDCISYFLGKTTSKELRGYMPINKKADTLKLRKNYIAFDTKKDFVFDPLKIEYMNKFLDKVKGIDVVFVVSPVWYGQDSASLDIVRKTCKERGIKLIDYSNDPKYVHNNEYFRDGFHMNAKGADVFTQDLIRELKGLRKTLF